MKREKHPAAETKRKELPEEGPEEVPEGLADATDRFAHFLERRIENSLDPN